MLQRKSLAIIEIPHWESTALGTLTSLPLKYNRKDLPCPEAIRPSTKIFPCWTCIIGGGVGCWGVGSPGGGPKAIA